MTQGYHDEHLPYYVLPAMLSTALLSQVIGHLAEELLYCSHGQVPVCSFPLYFLAEFKCSLSKLTFCLIAGSTLVILKCCLTSFRTLETRQPSFLELYKNKTKKK